MKNTICPQCGGQHIKQGVMFASMSKVHMYSPNNLRDQSSPISAKYCSDCGYVLAFYVDEPKNLQ